MIIALDKVKSINMQVRSVIKDNHTISFFTFQFSRAFIKVPWTVAIKGFPFRKTLFAGYFVYFRVFKLATYIFRH